MRQILFRQDVTTVYISFCYFSESFSICLIIHFIKQIPNIKIGSTKTVPGNINKQITIQNTLECSL